MNLSKSLYIRAIQCPKALWLRKYNPFVLTPPDEADKVVFETGNVAGIAYQVFSNEKEVLYAVDNLNSILDGRN